MNRVSRTFFVDQTKLNTLVELAAQFKDTPLDLIIDDGLHTVAANIGSLDVLSTTLRPGGVYVIEDVFYQLDPSVAAIANSSEFKCMHCPPRKREEQAG